MNKPAKQEKPMKPKITDSLARKREEKDWKKYLYKHFGFKRHITNNHDHTLEQVVEEIIESNRQKQLQRVREMKRHKPTDEWHYTRCPNCGYDEAIDDVLKVLEKEGTE